MAVILEFVNMAVPCGARQKSKQYDIDDLWDKFDAFGGIWTKISLTPRLHKIGSITSLTNTTSIVYHVSFRADISILNSLYMYIVL